MTLSLRHPRFIRTTTAKGMTLFLLGLLSPYTAYANPDWVCSKLKDPDFYDTMPDLAENKYIVQGKEGWVFETSNDLKTDYSFHPDVRRMLKKVQDKLAERGTTLLLLQLPSRGTLMNQYFPDNITDYGPFDPKAAWASYQDLATYQDKFGLNIVTLSDFDHAEDFYFKRDIHWKMSGMRLAGKAVATTIKKLPNYESLMKQKFSTTKTDFIKVEEHEAYSKIIKQYCGTTIPAEDYEIYKTSKLQGEVSESDLFDDQTAPIVLLGTSYSMREDIPSNFAGFIQEYSSLDVLNMAISGGGLDTSFIKYLEDGYDAENPPKILLWEVPGHYRFNTTRYLGVLEQILGMLDHDCSVPIDTKKLSSVTASTLIMKDLEQATQSGIPYTLTFTFSKPTPGNFSFIYRTISEDGTQRHRYKRTFSRRERAGDTDSYTMYLDIRDHEKLSAITLRGKSALARLDVTAQVCPVPAGSTEP